MRFFGVSVKQTCNTSTEPVSDTLFKLEMWLHIYQLWLMILISAYNTYRSYKIWCFEITRQSTAGTFSRLTSEKIISSLLLVMIFLSVFRIFTNLTSNRSLEKIIISCSSTANNYSCKILLLRHWLSQIYCIVYFFLIILNFSLRGF